MNNYPNGLKNKILSIIEEMKADLKDFVVNPLVDFTRKRKLDFAKMMDLILVMEGSNLNNEILKYFDDDEESPTGSAFIQQRAKILPYAFEYLFKNFTNSLENLKKYKGYRLLADDGSVFNIAHNADDEDTYIKGKPGNKGYNQIHVNALYDLMNKIYVDSIVQNCKQKNENSALCEMVNRCKIDGNVILTGDRGFESLNNFVTLQRKGWYYVIRVKDGDSNGILGNIKLPESDEFDVVLNLKITRKHLKEYKESDENYKFLSTNSTFDFIELESDEIYPLSIRVVRVKIAENTYQTLVTNLNCYKFTTVELKEIYRLRWGIETSFRELKYAMGLVNFHSKSVDSITKEVFSRLTMYNFCERITLSVVIDQKKTKHIYQVNFTEAIKICRRFYRRPKTSPERDVERLIRHHILPVRKNRQFERKIKSKTVVSFLYKVS